jgi:hypothetical protein
VGHGGKTYPNEWNVRCGLVVSDSGYRTVADSRGHGTETLNAVTGEEFVE